MRTITITDNNNIPLLDIDTVAHTIKDRHNGGRGTTTTTGFWVINNERLAIDHGDAQMHCLNEVCLNRDTGAIELGTSSVAGTYNPTRHTYEGWMTQVTERVTFDTLEEMAQWYHDFEAKQTNDEVA